MSWIAGVVTALVLFQRGLAVLATVVAAVCLATLPLISARARAVRRFRREWAGRGKDLVLIYSNSPHWRSHVENAWLPRWGERAVVLNWSERSAWGKEPSSAIELFRVFGGAREFNPLAIVVPSSGDVRVVRFWRPFQQHKRGKPGLLAAAEAELADHLRQANNA